MNATLLERFGSSEMVDFARLSIHRELPPLDRLVAHMRRLARDDKGSITASGLYGLTLEKQFIDTIGLSLESETAIKVMMCEDGYTPNFDTHNFRDDVTNEVSGTGYSAGGSTLTTTEITLASGLLTYDGADVAWPSSTIPNAMAAVGYFARGGASSADELMWLSDFVTAASTTNGTFTIAWHANGIFTVDYTP